MPLPNSLIRSIILRGISVSNYVNDFESVVPRKLLEIHILRLYSRPTESKLWRWSPAVCVLMSQGILM